MDLLDVLKGSGDYCINGGKYLLVELPAVEIPRYTEDFFFTLQTRGIYPILAHPERNSELIKNPQILAAWINKGIMVQINAPSIMGRFGAKIMQTAELLLKNNMVHFVGTDAHGIQSRRPILNSAADKIMNLIGKEQAEIILKQNPNRMLNSEEIHIDRIPGLIYKQSSNHWFQSIIRKIWA